MDKNKYPPVSQMEFPFDISCYNFKTTKPTNNTKSKSSKPHNKSSQIEFDL